VLVSVSALLAMPFYFVCGINHFCIGGHMAHPPYAWYHFANDLGWLTFLVAALVFSFKSNIHKKKTFIILTILVLVHILNELSLIFAIGLIVTSIRELRKNKGFNESSNNSIEATPDDAPHG